MTAPAAVAVEYSSQTYAEAGSQANLAGDFLGNFHGVISPDGNYFYHTGTTGGSGDLHITDISDPSNPSTVGTVTAIDGLCNNVAITGLAFDSTGRYLYVPNGASSMYTLDLSPDPESPVLDHTLTIPTATDNRHTIVRVDNNASFPGRFIYVLGDTTVHRIDLNTPDTPLFSVAFTITSGIGDGIASGYESPDGNYILYPEIDDGSPTGQIAVVGVATSSPPSTGDQGAINLPNFSGASEVITVSGALCFSSDADLVTRLWFIGKYTSSGNDSYFWMVYDKGGSSTWGQGVPAGEEIPVVISDAIDASGEITPSHYLSNEPYDSIAWGVADGEIVVEKTKSTSGEGNFISFYALNPEEVFPTLVIKEGGRRTQQLTDFNFFRSASIASNLIVGVVQFQTVIGDTTTITGVVGVVVPTSVTTTVVGWVDITSDIRFADEIKVSHGITGDRIRDRIAQTGTMSFSLNNHATEGLYSPGHTNQSANFEIGAPVRLQISRAGSATPLFTKFLGRIESLTPKIDLSGGEVVEVTCVDAMDVLSRARVKGLSVRTSITAKRIVDISIDAATGLPITTNVTNGVDTTPDVYDFAFVDIEDEEAPIIAEIRRAADSERGFFYPAYQHADLGSDGGFRFESRATRINSPVFNTTILGDGTLSVITPEHSADVVYNRVQVRVFPREQDSAATTVLFTLQNSPRLKFGESITFTASYSDPSERASRVSGTEMQPPISGTDYKFTGREGGGGAILTANIAVLVEFGGSSAEVTVTNNGGTGFLSLFQLKGKGLYSYEPVTSTKRSLLSIVKHGLSDVLFELPYIEDLVEAGAVATSVLDSYATVKTFIRRAELVPSRSSATLDAFIDGEIGDKFFVENDVLAVSVGTTVPYVLGTSALGTGELADGDVVYVIHSINFSIGDANLIQQASWGLFPASVRL